MQICVATCNMAEFISIFALPFPAAPGEVQTELCMCVSVCVCVRACACTEGGKSENLHNKLGWEGGKGKRRKRKTKTLFWREREAVCVKGAHRQACDLYSFCT